MTLETTQNRLVQSKRTIYVSFGQFERYFLDYEKSMILVNFLPILIGARSKKSDYRGFFYQSEIFYVIYIRPK
jgi:hypothetical protein